MSPLQEPDPRQLATYFAIAQVGMEMVLPGVLGFWLDSTFDWLPWGTIVGVVCGFVLGIAHLVVLMKRANDAEPPRRGKVP
jgi:F0F1-type ATP synthase assembly protein I